MLVLSRKIGERILIEPGIEIAVVDVRGGKVRIGIVAPDSVRIRREELSIRPQADTLHRPSPTGASQKVSPGQPAGSLPLRR